MSITLLDGILVVIMLISAILAMIRGFSREILSIVSWVAAAVAAAAFYKLLSPTIASTIPTIASNPPFPPELAATTDKLEIVRTWQFQENSLGSD